METSSNSKVMQRARERARGKEGQVLMMAGWALASVAVPGWTLALVAMVATVPVLVEVLG